MAKSRMINSSRWQKQATILITKELQAIADDTGVNVRQVIADKLKESYKQNLKASYTPRSVKGWETMANNDFSDKKHKRKLTYHHTNTLYDSVYASIEGNYVRIRLRDNEYDKGAGHSVSVEEVYNYLTKGTNKHIGVNYAYTADGKTSGGINYPTEKHHFEDWTRLEMLGFLDTLNEDVKNGKYTTYRYTGKKKKRTHYRGEEVI